MDKILCLWFLTNENCILPFQDFKSMLFPRHGNEEFHLASNLKSNYDSI